MKTRARTEPKSIEDSATRPTLRKHVLHLVSSREHYCHEGFAFARNRERGEQYVQERRQMSGAWEPGENICMNRSAR
ncbi:MAG TPA: hypothetical protein VJV79_01410, partial [Polyangiaceae bacterium]|nr:hypothetical protein [Polyangiaceae bacterium]